MWLRGDATRITGRVQYDSPSNQLIGIVLPFDDNGMPVAFSFPATSAKAIHDHFQNNTPASYSYSIMVQPLQNDAPCFCLCLFGTNNKFREEHVTKRWKYITEQLEIEGVKTVGISSDGDSRLMKAMRLQSSLGIDSPTFLIAGQN